jgi:hypothetical protein
MDQGLFATGLASILLSLASRNPTSFAVWILGFCSLISFVAFRKRSVRAGLVSAFSWMVMAEGFFRGIMMRPHPPENFRANVELVKESRNRQFVLAAGS